MCYERLPRGVDDDSVGVEGGRLGLRVWKVLLPAMASGSMVAAAADAAAWTQDTSGTVGGPDLPSTSSCPSHELPLVVVTRTG